MSEEIAGIEARGMLNRLSSKTHVSMESTQNVSGVAPSMELQKLEAMQGEINHAFGLMHEIRGKLEEAYQQLSR